MGCWSPDFEFLIAWLVEIDCVSLGEVDSVGGVSVVVVSVKPTAELAVAPIELSSSVSPEVSTLRWLCANLGGEQVLLRASVVVDS